MVFLQSSRLEIPGTDGYFKKNDWCPVKARGETELMKMRFPISAACLLLLLCGCVFESYRPVGKFDLPIGEPERTARPVRVFEFRNDSTAGIRFQACDRTGRVTRDPYNSWALPPGQLVARALNLSMRPAAETAAPVLLIGTLEVFEVDSARKVFRLAGHWSPLDDDDVIFRFDETVPVIGDTAEATAQAAGAAVRRLATRIALWSSRTNPEQAKK